MREAAIAYLRKSRKLLTDVGWVKGAFIRYSDWQLKEVKGYCSVGALDHAYKPTKDVKLRKRRARVKDVARTALVAAVSRTKSPAMTSYPSIVEYNDMRGRTKEQILALFDSAIKLLKTKEI